jgi:hypothetical protein
MGKLQCTRQIVNKLKSLSLIELWTLRSWVGTGHVSLLTP